jgi:hypothetical protein
MSSARKNKTLIVLAFISGLQLFQLNAQASVRCSNVFVEPLLQTYYRRALQDMNPSWQRKLTHNGQPHWPEQTQHEARELGFVSFNIVKVIVDDLKSGDDQRIAQAFKVIPEYKIHGLQYDEPYSPYHNKVGRRVLNQDLIEEALEQLVAMPDGPSDLKDQAQAQLNAWK